MHRGVCVCVGGGGGGGERCRECVCGLCSTYCLDMSSWGQNEFQAIVTILNLLQS